MAPEKQPDINERQELAIMMHWQCPVKAGIGDNHWDSETLMASIRSEEYVEDREEGRGKVEKQMDKSANGRTELHQFPS